MGMTMTQKILAAHAGLDSVVALDVTKEVIAEAETDFFTVTRRDSWGISTWLMCTSEAAKKLIAMDFENLTVEETIIVG